MNDEQTQRQREVALEQIKNDIREQVRNDLDRFPQESGVLDQPFIKTMFHAPKVVLVTPDKDGWRSELGLRSPLNAMARRASTSDPLFLFRPTEKLDTRPKNQEYSLDKLMDANTKIKKGWISLAQLRGRLTYALALARAKNEIILTGARQIGKSRMWTEQVQIYTDHAVMTPRKFWAKYSSRPKALQPLSMGRFRRFH